MVPGIRKAYNDSFSAEKYTAFLQALDAGFPGAIEFRVAETPVFIDKTFAQKIFDACECIIDVITEPGFKALTDRAIPAAERVPNENDHAHMIAFDFGICTNDKGELEPQLIEMQGFPTLFGFQVYLPDIMRTIFPVPGNFSQYLNGLSHDSYLLQLKEVIVGNHPVENVILLK